MRLTRTAAGLAALAVAATMIAAVGARLAPAEAAVRPSCPAGAVEARSARAAAVACGGSVEIVGQRSGPDRVFANADGSSTIVMSRSRWAYANTANFTYGDAEGVARVGRNPACCGGTWRGFLEFGLGPVAGAEIVAASFTTVAVHSWSCVPRPVSLYRTGAIAAGVGDGGRTPWSPPLLEVLGTQNIHGCNGGQPMSVPITTQVRAWVAAATGSVTLGLVNPNESSVEHWKKFSVAQTFLVITYTTPQ